ncbi:hypothetical protein [Frankia sp. QA3]|uniref:hypothetical protein n=1 Tax=Frankia sp. QA3 TaxID=710111 RepID=UPI000269CF08|nr:hypothetical protein [Frankia sp. QA3]EIV95830.1 hypothetical protein FraQA3DRAFT_5682 [Frankia sp. QA3]
MAVNSAQYLVEPALAMLTVGLLMVMARWASTPLRALPRGVVLGHDFGLLVPVAVVDTPAEVSRARAALRTQGIRSTWAMAMTPLHIDAAGNILSRPRQRRHVLVFGADAARAARALAAPPGGLSSQT